MMVFVDTVFKNTVAKIFDKTPEIHHDDDLLMKFDGQLSTP
jgi:hypothetical protein